MSFTTLQFPFFFIAVLVGLLFLKPDRRWIWLVASSCWFYMAFIPAYILILVFLIVIDFFAGILIEGSIGRRRKLALCASLVANIALLSVFKYLNFFLDNIHAISTFFGRNSAPWHMPWVLPIGLSFHTFQSMAYTIEVYSGRQKAERHFGIYSLYVLFFPQMVAGPIERPQNFLQQFRTPAAVDPERLASGGRLMAWGFFKKLVVANRLAEFVNASFDPGFHPGGGTMLAAAYFFAFEIYCDFSGYTDIARGAARCMGYELMVNFDRPYASRSPSEFWRRWHISLSTWFRDYLFIPLGGSRKGLWRTCLNSMVVFVVSGFWHGAAWNFLAWGALHGLYLVVYRLAGLDPKRSGTAWSNALRIVVTFQLTTLAWIFFRSNSLGLGVRSIRDILSAGTPREFLSVLGRGDIRFGILLILLLESVQWARDRGLSAWLGEQRTWVRWTAWYALLTLIVVLGKFGNEQFIYFQF
jgi:D-alanyl-lipoteichoic acid acyltransferase DltB (MBOAT superfamily)